MLINSSILWGEELEYIEEANIEFSPSGVKVGCGFVAGALDLKDRLAIPGLFNAHTHLGDSYAKDACKNLSVKEAVGRKGLKWALYEGSKREERVKAMRGSMEYMLRSGTTAYSDFREFGLSGVQELEEAAEGLRMKKVILGRDLPIETCAGLGLNIYQKDQIPMDRKDKLIALHAGEVPGEIEEALECDPDIIIHATSATSDELYEIADRKISVVVCPRANAALRVGFPQIDLMGELGINVCIGTDNVMLNSPDMWREMDYVLKNTKLDAKEVLEMACVNPREVFGLDLSELTFLDKGSYNLRDSKDIYAAVAARCDRCDVKEVIVDGFIL